MPTGDYLFICPKTGEEADDFYCCMLCDSPPDGCDDDDTWQTECWNLQMYFENDVWKSVFGIRNSKVNKTQDSLPNQKSIRKA